MADDQWLRTMISDFAFDRSCSITEDYKVNYDIECSFCRKNRQMVLVNEEYEHPEPTFIKRLPVSVAALSYDQSHLGRTVVVLRDHETDLNFFMETKYIEFMAFMEDVSIVSNALMETFKPERINYAVYMNQNNHLHMHLIPRYLTEEDKYTLPPEFVPLNDLDPAIDYRSLAKSVRKNMKRSPSQLSLFMEKVINHGLPE